MLRSVFINVTVFAATLLLQISRLHTSELQKEWSDNTSGLQSTAITTTEAPIICGNKTCDSGAVCVYPAVLCTEDTVCIPPPPQCVTIWSEYPVTTDKPIDPCANTTCPEGYDCVKSQEDTSLAKCQYVVPCAKIQCGRGYECETFPKKCPLLGPCKVYGECVRVDPCRFSNCYEGQVCVPSENDPTQSECKRRDPCTEVKCKSGYACKVVTPSCPTIFPCPEPYAECIPINPCYNVTCKAGRYCTQSVQDPKVAECVKNPCDYSVCPVGKTCEAIQEYCKAPPCPRPRTHCIKDLCGSVYCDTGYVCKNISVTDCKGRKCSSSTKKCVAIDPCANKFCAEGYECVKSQEDTTKAKCQYIVPCAKIKCERGYECETFPKRCPLLGPCKTYGRCVRVDPCRFSNCYEGQTCVPSENDPTKSECKRLTD